MSFKMYFKIFRHLPKSIYFNLHYLKIKDAIKLPILFLSKVKFQQLKGSVRINGKIFPGMILIGADGNVLYNQNRNACIWANYGGIVEFSKNVRFCVGNAFEIGQHGILTFGENIYFGPMVRIACYEKIVIGDNSRVAWESIILDTDFHSTIDISTGKHSSITKPIHIGRNNWIGIRCFVMKGTETPDFCIASAYSLVNKRFEIPNYSLIGGIPAKFLKEGLYRDLHSHVNELQQEHHQKK